MICDEVDAPRHLLAAGDVLTAARRAEQTAVTADPAAKAQLLALAVEARGLAAGARLRLDAAAALLAVNQPVPAVTIIDQLDSADPVTRAEACWYRSQAAWLAGDEALAERHCDEALSLAAGTGSTIEVRLLIERGTQRVRTRLGDPSVIDDAQRCLVGRQ